MKEGAKDIACGAYFSVVYKRDGKVLVFGDNKKFQLGIGMDIEYQKEPALLMEDKNITKIVCGLYHIMILKKHGELWVPFTCSSFLFKLNSNVKGLWG